MGIPKTRGYPNHCDTAILKSEKTLGARLVSRPLVNACGYQARYKFFPGGRVALPVGFACKPGLSLT